MTPVLANPNPQYSLSGLRLHPEAALRNPAAQARLQARPLRAYVRGPAGRRRGGARAVGSRPQSWRPRRAQRTCDAAWFRRLGGTAPR